MERKTFIKTTGTVLAGSLITSGLHANTFGASNKKIRVAMIGTGNRGMEMWCKPVIKEYGDVLEFVGLCDINEGRVKYFREATKLTCPVYTDFDKMMQETKLDKLIVTTVDGFHHQYIIKGMEYGADIVSEKPMTTTEAKCRAILDAEKRTGKKVTVTFNYRYSPHRQKIYELLRAGAIGDITSVDFHWYLDVYHGADYFRRWHRLRENSGSLLVHKASHHFDLLNWWIDSDPKTVYGNGSLDFYGKNGAVRGENCRDCEHKKDCKFFWDITKKKDLYEMYVPNYS